MTSKLSTLGLALILSVLVIGGCVPASNQPMEAATATPSQLPTAVPTQVSVKASEPAVKISPTSGPSGTSVQVVASGFPPNTFVSVGVGPVNSEFGQAAQGTTDANGAFVVQVPVEGAPGMSFVFAVAVQGQPGITSPDLFQIVETSEPAVTISPTSGPSGTSVQVVASGFPPNTFVSAGVGPVNSEFGQAAQGTTDANGAFVVQVPVEGAPGMSFVFAVAVEGQPGIASPDLFQIVEAPEPAVTISPNSGPSGTQVQVVASGFPPNTLVSVGVGPVNSEFGQVAQGTTDANGAFVVQVPVEGAPGMSLVFAVAVQGQPGIASPDLFQIVEAPEPAVTISPTSGPSGTQVQVVASGFPPNTLVSVGVGPVNSEFGQVAQGTTDANGAFVVQVPVEGAPGMSLVFAVAVEGQPGSSSFDLFHITSAVPTATPMPSPVLTPAPTPTPYQDMWITFSSLAYAMSLEYPADWQSVPGHGSPETGETRFAASNGFFQIGAMDATSIDDVAAAEAGHRLQPYGSQPTIETLQIQGQEARLILPSDDQPAGMQNQAAIIIRYPQPVNVVGTPCRYFVLWADWPHIRTIAQTLRFTS